VAPVGGLERRRTADRGRVEAPYSRGSTSTTWTAPQLRSRKRSTSAVPVATQHSRARGSAAMRAASPEPSTGHGHWRRSRPGVRRERRQGSKRTCRDAKPGTPGRAASGARRWRDELHRHGKRGVDRGGRIKPADALSHQYAFLNLRVRGALVADTLSVPCAPRRPASTARRRSSRGRES
jgi:hypothetical protein